MAGQHLLIAEGKYLNLHFDRLDKRGTLNVDRKELGCTVCPACDLKPRCVEADTVKKLTVYCPFVTGSFPIEASGFEDITIVCRGFHLRAIREYLKTEWT